MSPREHARLARMLIDACGGLAEASEAAGVSKSVLSTSQNPNETTTMSARVIAELEAYCAKPIYSSFLRRQVGLDTEAGCLKDLACLFTEEGAGFQSYVRKALADDTLTPNEIDAARRELAQAETVLMRCRASLDAAEQSFP